MLAPPQSVGILGGMGPAAGADFVRLFVEACTDYLQSHGEEVRDQSFPEHWLVQMPIPDRSIAIQQSAADVQDPAPHLLQGVGRLAALGVRSVAVACNTAHVWHGQMQALFPQLSILHIAEETARHLQRQGVQQAILLATAGTYRTGLYDQTLRAHGITPLTPADDGVQRLMQGIYEGVKRGDLDFAARRFGEVLAPLLDRHGPLPVVMGCTEIPLALPRAREAEGALLIDPSRILAQALARRAYEAH
ncbi:aspartate/glutamate racemase family protein [Diaphorobacter caeni]|uniref:aspartate/glutamate racemase family protein n=1 Tax=Diaphorobacter caeni TaxID=2784387 RepID=UPI00188F8489|nr:amino acid racemase [Diaphorobacter caeni]MBF5005111.1 aspartate/glutamate racemase family protein [Diaphorobacter caeni]